MENLEPFLLTFSNIEISDLWSRNDHPDHATITAGLYHTACDLLNTYLKTREWAKSNEVSLTNFWKAVCEKSRNQASVIIRQIIAELVPLDLVQSVLGEGVHENDIQPTETMDHLLYFINTWDDPYFDLSALFQNVSKVSSLFSSTSDLLVMDEAIVRVAVALLIEKLGGDPAMFFSYQSQLSTMHLQRYQRSRDLSDIERASWYLAQAILTSLKYNIDPSTSARLYRLGRTLAKFLWESIQLQEADLHVFTSVLKQIYLIQIEDETKASLLDAMTDIYLLKIDPEGNSTGLDEALACFEQALRMSPEARMASPIWLQRFGWCYTCRFRISESLADIDQAIVHLSQANSIAQDQHPYKQAIVDQLCKSLLFRFDHLGNVSDVDETIAHQLHRLSLAPDGSRSHSKILVALGVAYELRYGRLGNLSDLSSAIAYSTEVLSLIPNLAMAHSLLSKLYLHRYLQLGQYIDLQQSIGCRDQSLKLVGDDPFENSEILSHSAALHDIRFHQEGEMSDIDRAIEHQLQAVKLYPRGYPRRINGIIALGRFYQCRFLHSRQIADIDEAINQLLQALIQSPDTHTCKSLCFQRLGDAYSCRFTQLGEFKDCDEAVRAHMLAVSSCPMNHPSRPEYLMSWAATLSHRFRRLGHKHDIDTAILQSALALSLVPDGHIHKPEILQTLGDLHLYRCSPDSELSDINRSIEYFSLAVSLLPKTHAGLVGLLRRLGNSYKVRFEQTHELSDIDQAVELLSQSVNGTSSENTARCDRLLSLGFALFCRWKYLGNQSDLDKIIHSFQTGALSSKSPPFGRLFAASEWAKACKYARTPYDALPAYALVVELFPKVAWIGLPIAGRYRVTWSLQHLLIAGAATAIDTKSYNLALEWLEQGRSVVWKQLLQLRSVVDELRLADYKLASRLEQVALLLEQVDSNPCERSTGIDSHAVSFERVPQQRRRLAGEWDELLVQIRQLPNFINFMQPTTAAELARSAHSSAVVVLALSRDSCNALLIRKNSQTVEHIPLPWLTSAMAASASEQIKSSLSSSCFRETSRAVVYKSNESRDRFKWVLTMLWFCVVQPVLDYLGYMSTDQVSELPRVTWCCTGPLSFLPLHAAGDYRMSGSGARIFQYVVSSYTPTLLSLIPSPKPPTPFTGILAISQSHTPGQVALPGSIEEVERIIEIAKGVPHTHLHGNAATSTTVIAAMNHHSWVHFACHASQNLTEPRSSAFILHESLLSLQEMIEKHNDAAEFAFLSACQTATGDESIPNEAVHLAAGMLMAGYRTVIATMWSIRDEDAPLVAEHVYSYLLQGDTPDAQRASKALHHAVAKLREKVEEDNFAAWVPYLHLGL